VHEGEWNGYGRGVEWGVWVCLVQRLGEAAGVSPLKRHCFPS